MPPSAQAEFLLDFFLPSHMLSLAVFIPKKHAVVVDGLHCGLPVWLGVCDCGVEHLVVVSANRAVVVSTTSAELGTHGRALSSAASNRKEHLLTSTVSEVGQGRARLWGVLSSVCLSGHLEWYRSMRQCHA